MFVTTRLLMFEVNNKLHMVFKVPNSNSGSLVKLITLIQIIICINLKINLSFQTSMLNCTEKKYS